MSTWKIFHTTEIDTQKNKIFLGIEESLRGFLLEHGREKIATVGTFKEALAAIARIENINHEYLHVWAIESTQTIRRPCWEVDFVAKNCQSYEPLWLKHTFNG